MKNVFKIILLMTTIGFTAQAFAAGDYIWEEKFKKEMSKAEQGNAKSQYAIGEMYEKGKGTEKNTAKAFAWYSKAAKQNNKKAAYKIGLAYMEGKGVKKNYRQALNWFRKSANKKYVRAEYYLGVMYENGQGIPRNLDEAMKWYKRALAGGYANAAEGIKRVSKAQKAAEQERRSVAVKINKPKTVRTPKPKIKPTPKPVTKRKSTKEKVLAGGWKKRNKPVEYLPSAITQCKENGNRVECLSAELTRNIGMANINYTTKASLFDFKKNGEFKIAYRNNVAKIKITDPEFEESGGKVPVKLGWQDADHKLTCTFENDRSLVCTKNKLRKIKLRR